MKPLFLIPLLFAIRLAAIELPEFQDGQDVGNGGDVLVCPKGTAMPGTFLLDYYEGETRYGFHLIQEESEAPTVIAQHLVERMSVDPIRRKMYLDQLGTFMNEALFIPNTTLIDVPDSEHIALPKGCAVEQVAIQLIPQFPEEKRYTVSKDLWDDMTPSHRAGLMVHEILYREVLESHKNSIRVRYFNSLLAAKEFGDPTVFEYSLLLQRIRFPVGYLNFQGYLLSSITYENGQVRAGYFFYPSELAKPFVIQGKTLSFSGSGMVWFHPSGKIAQLTGSLTAPVELELVTGSRQLVGMPLFVDENQKVSGGIAGRSFSVLQYENCELEIQTGNQFRLFDTGRIAVLEHSENLAPVVLCHSTLGGKVFMLKVWGEDNRYITFYPNGLAQLGHFASATFEVFGGIPASLGSGWGFHPSGVPKTARLMEKTELYNTQGVTVWKEKGETLEFDAQGRITN